MKSSTQFAFVCLAAPPPAAGFTSSVEIVCQGKGKAFGWQRPGAGGEEDDGRVGNRQAMTRLS
jgi:hypothetical protein